MTMNISKMPRKIHRFFVAAGVVLASFGAWAATQNLVPNDHAVIPQATKLISRESVPAAPYDQDTEEVIIPSLQGGKLILSRVRKPEVGASTTIEVSRRIVALGVYRLADVNRLTGEYLYQTINNNGGEDMSKVTTWLGDVNGQSVRVCTGAGYVKLSPGGARVAVTDSNGVLWVVDTNGSGRISLGKASNAVFSPDGSELAYFKTIPYADSNGGISVIDLASGKVLATYAPDGSAYVPVAFSEDGGTLFFLTDTVEPLDGNDPANTDRVDLFALPLSEGSVPQLITSGAKKLPYIDYTRVENVPGAHALVFSAENTIWVVDTQTGNIQTFPNAVDGLTLGTDNVVLVRPIGKGAVSQVWNALIVQ